MAARVHVRLTDDLLRDTLQPGMRFWDEEVRSLYVAHGKRAVSFGVEASVATRHRARWTRSSQRRVRNVEHRFARWPEVSCRAARAEAKELIARLRRGADPRLAHVGPGGPTLAEAFDEYLIIKRKLRPGTIAHYRGCMARLAGWHLRPLGEIALDSHGLADRHRRLTSDSGPAAADNTLAFLGIVYRRIRAAHPEMALPAWPEAAVERHGRRRRTAGLDDPADWWRRVRRLQNPVKRQWMIFTLLSGLRSEDSRTTRWSEFDARRMALHRPSPKGGEARAFDLPVSRAMLRCMTAARKAWADAGRPPSDYIFPSDRSESGHFEDARAKHRGRDGETSLVETGHRLRHAWTAFARIARVAEADQQMLLNHTPQNVTQGYPDPRALHRHLVEEMERISAVIVRALGRPRP